MSVYSSFQVRKGQLLDLVEPRIPLAVTPNRLSWSRVWGIPLIWGLYMYNPLIGLCLYVVICVTDLFDGYLANKRNLATPYGKKLDENTDKGLMLGIIALLFADQLVPLDYGSWLFWTVAVLVVRDAAIWTMRTLWPEIADRVPSLPLAKAKTLFVMPAFGCMLVGKLEHSVWLLMYNLGIGLLVIAVCLSVVSGGQYVYEFWKRA